MWNRVNDKNPKDWLDSTPLNEAATHGHLQICQLIIENIDDNNPKGCLDSTPLHEAAKHGHLKICQFIIENIDDKNPKDRDSPTLQTENIGTFGHL